MANNSVNRTQIPLRGLCAGYLKRYVSKTLKGVTIVKIMSLVSLSLVLSSCAYTSNIGVKEGTPASQLATITFPNTIEVEKIDNKEFDQKGGIWQHGSQTVNLAPGMHSFTFHYSEDTPYGGNFTRDATTLEASLRAGHYYDITHEVRGSRMHFTISDLSDPSSQQ